MSDMDGLYVSEVDQHREPLAAEMAELLFAAGTLKRVDSQGRPVDENGEFTEGEFDVRLGEYVPHRKQDPELSNELETPETPKEPDAAKSASTASGTRKAGAK